MAISLISLATSILHLILPLSLFVLSGVAIALSVWVVPIMILPTTPSRTITEQFKEVIRRGYMYLQSSCRCLAIALLATTVLTYYHPNENVASKWKWYAAAFGTLIQAAWYEVVFVFPINDRAIAMGEKLEDDELWLTHSEHAKLHGLMRSWRRWHFGRIVAAFVPGCLTLAALL